LGQRPTVRYLLLLVAQLDYLLGADRHGCKHGLA
jgi:hypothetical protein